MRTGRPVRLIFFFRLAQIDKDPFRQRNGTPNVESGSVYEALRHAFRRSAEPNSAILDAKDIFVVHCKKDSAHRDTHYRGPISRGEQSIILSELKEGCRNFQFFVSSRVAGNLGGGTRGAQSGGAIFLTHIALRPLRLSFSSDKARSQYWDGWHFRRKAELNKGEWWMP